MEQAEWGRLQGGSSEDETSFVIIRMVSTLNPFYKALLHNMVSLYMCQFYIH